MLDDAVEEVKALVVVGLGSDELLEDSQQTRLWEEQTQEGQHAGGGKDWRRARGEDNGG